MRPPNRTRDLAGELARKQKASGVLALLGAAGLIWNHYSIVSWGEGFMSAVVFCPLLLCLGAAGWIDPRIVAAATKGGEWVPPRFRVLAGAAVLAGGGLAIYLGTVVYEFL